MTPQRVLFTGSRTYSDRHIVRAVIDGLRMAVWDDGLDPAADLDLFITVAHGAARGLDELVDQVIPVNANVRVRRYPAAWGVCDHEHPKVPCPPGTSHRRRHSRYTLNSSLQDETYCPLAGIRRNQTMLDDFEPDLVVAFLDKTYDSSRGTKDMCERAAKAGVHIHVITTGGRP